MPSPTDPCRLLPWDTAWWGVPTALVTIPLDEADAARRVDAWCLHHSVGLLYLLVPSAEIRTAQVAEANGFLIMDVRITLSHDQLLSTPTPSSVGNLRVAGRRDAAALGDIAAVSYRVSRFYADPHLPDARCDAALPAVDRT